MHALADYLLFFVKTLTLLAAFLLAILGLVAIKGRNKAKEQGELHVEALNPFYKKLKESLQEACQSDEENKAWLRQEKKEKKNKKRLEKSKKKHKKKKTDTLQSVDPSEDGKKKTRLFVIDFKGDIRASQNDALTREIDAVILNHRPGDEVLLRLESGGGMVHAYGLATSQLERLKEKNIPLTVAVDKIAASGGYMMAAVADTLVAAPYAILGSIGVVMQMPNLHRFLEHNRIDFEQLTAGKYKRTLTLLGKNTSEGRKKMQSELEETHLLFQDHLKRARPQLDLERVATGEHWYGLQAQTLHLVDALETSEARIMRLLEQHAVYRVHYKIKASLAQRIGSASEQGLQWLRSTLGASNQA